MFITTHRTIFFTLTGIVAALSLASIFVFGLHLSIDFTGGSLAVANYPAGRPPVTALNQSLNAAGFKDYELVQQGTSGYSMRTQTLTDTQRAGLAQTLSVGGKYPDTITQLNEIGPTIGAQLRRDSIIAVSLVLVCILLFIAFAFRKVSRPISSWMYGAMAIVGLINNVIITAGFFALLGHLTGAQVDTLFVTAVLTVLGFSIHDTIVVFDRVRENLRVNHDQNKKEDFAITAGRSLNQTFVRSINTSLTVVFTLFVLYMIGPASTQNFALTLLVGIVAGTYSSLFLATPLLVAIEKSRNSK